MQTELKQFGFLFANRKLHKCKFGVKHFTVQTSVKYDSLLKPHTDRTETVQFFTCQSKLHKRIFGVNYFTIRTSAIYDSLS